MESAAAVLSYLDHVQKNPPSILAFDPDFLPGVLNNLVLGFGLVDRVQANKNLSLLWKSASVSGSMIDFQSDMLARQQVRQMNLAFRNKAKKLKHKYKITQAADLLDFLPAHELQEGTIPPEVLKIINEAYVNIDYLAVNLEPDRYKAFLQRANKPELGPSSLEELHVVSSLALKLLPGEGIQPDVAVSLFKILKEIDTDIARLSDDVPAGKKTALHNTDKTIETVARCSKANVDNSLLLINFFLNNHGNKIPARAAYDLGQKIFMAMDMLGTAKIMEVTSPAEFRQDTFEETVMAVQDYFQEVYFKVHAGTYMACNSSCPIPSAEDVIQHHLQRYDEALSDPSCTERQAERIRKNIETLLKVRDKRPEEMQETVIFYASQNDGIKQIREKLFKKYDSGSDNGNYRKKFLIALATGHADLLEKIGLPGEAIVQMGKTGTVPYDPDGNQYDLTVDHVVDREMGGTNHPHNLLLVPGKVNRNKNSLVQLQAGSYADKETGFWVVTWQPKTEGPVLDIPGPVGINRNSEKGMPCTEFVRRLNHEGTNTGHGTPRYDLC